MRVRVLGAGCFGLCAATALLARGHDVEVVDPAGVGAGATGRAAGILSTVTWDEREARLIQETRRALQGGPLAHVLRPSPSLVVGREARLEELGRRVRAVGDPAALIEPDLLARRVPGLLLDTPALVLGGDATIEAGDLAAGLADMARQDGGRIVTRSTTRPDAQVIAMGAWSAAALREHGYDAPLAAYRTQAARLTGITGPILHDLERGFYCRPDGEGLLAGDGTELRPVTPATVDPQPSAAFKENIAAGVAARFRHGADARWQNAWTGLCVGTPDRHALCGRVPGHDDLFVLAGDNGFGLMRCLALGERLADAVDDVVHDWLDPGRFGASPGAGFRLREGFGDLD